MGTWSYILSAILEDTHAGGMLFRHHLGRMSINYGMLHRLHSYMENNFVEREASKAKDTGQIHRESNYNMNSDSFEPV